MPDLIQGITMFDWHEQASCFYVIKILTLFWDRPGVTVHDIQTSRYGNNTAKTTQWREVKAACAWKGQRGSKMAGCHLTWAEEAAVKASGEHWPLLCRRFVWGRELTLKWFSAIASTSPDTRRCPLYMFLTEHFTVALGGGALLPLWSWRRSGSKCWSCPDKLIRKVPRGF